MMYIVLLPLDFKSIDYTLPATFMNSKQCHKLNVHLHKVFLPRIGVDSHLPLVYRYAPHRFQGLNSLHIEATQFVENLSPQNQYGKFTITYWFQLSHFSFII